MKRILFLCFLFLSAFLLFRNGKSNIYQNQINHSEKNAPAGVVNENREPVNEKNISIDNTIVHFSKVSIRKKPVSQKAAEPSPADPVQTSPVFYDTSVPDAVPEDIADNLAPETIQPDKPIDAFPHTEAEEKGINCSLNTKKTGSSFISSPFYTCASVAIAFSCIVYMTNFLVHSLSAS